MQKLLKSAPQDDEVLEKVKFSKHRGQNSKQINIAKYVSKFFIYCAKMLDKCAKSQKNILYIVLFCKVKLSKMASIKTNKIKKPTALF